ncbi:SDR family oxidoreductase, partial [Candidatus Gottesmanbacteria bacterium]|nr:SDR family oxidoreductase [Candidatus Gottesmanbacteria bacterium]
LRLIKCDVADDSDIKQLMNYFFNKAVHWDIFMSCVGNLRPLTGFFQSKFNDWQKSVDINAISQLRILHGIYPLRNKKGISNAVFFAGGGVNSAVLDMSAYTVSKIMLIKMCEILDAECPDLNIFAVGPGWTKTKIHNHVFSGSDVSAQKRKETSDFLQNEKSTSLSDIYKCIMWLINAGRKISGGRNFSVVHDPWKGKSRTKLIQELERDPNKYKLRRYKND